MSGGRVLGLILFAVGVVLLVMGWNASHSVGEQLRETFTGHYSDRTTWYVVGGIASAIAGLALTFGSGRRRI